MVWSVRRKLNVARKSRICWTPTLLSIRMILVRMPYLPTRGCACSTINNFNRTLSHVSLPRDTLTTLSDAHCLLQVLLQTSITFHSAQNLLKTIFPPLLPQHGQPSCQNVVSHTIPEKA